MLFVAGDFRTSRSVRALAVRDGTIYAGGAFLLVDGRQRRGLAAFEF